MLPEEQLEEEQTEQTEEQTEEQTQEVNPAEERALKMGWVPKDDFRGDPDKWRPAEEFLERGERMIPILNKKIRDLRQQQEEKDKAFASHLSVVRDKLHGQRLEEHESRKREAVEAGDSETYDRLSRETPKNDIPEYKPPEQKNDPVFEEWKDENAWYSTDYERHQEAENYGQFLKGTRPELMGREFLDEVTAHVKQKFSNPNRNKPSAVDSGTQKASGTPGKLYNSLSAEAKATFNQFVRERIFQDNAADREAYAKDVLG